MGLSIGIRAVGTGEEMSWNNKFDKGMEEIRQNHAKIIKMLDQLLEREGLPTGSGNGETRTPEERNQSTWKEDEEVSHGSSFKPPPLAPKPPCIYCEKGFCCYRVSCKLAAKKMANWRKILDSKEEEEEADSNNNTPPPSSDEEEISLMVSESESESESEPKVTLELLPLAPSPPPSSPPPLMSPSTSPLILNHGELNEKFQKQNLLILEETNPDGEILELVISSRVRGMAMNPSNKPHPPPPPLVPPTTPPYLRIENNNGIAYLISGSPNRSFRKLKMSPSPSPLRAPPPLPPEIEAKNGGGMNSIGRKTGVQRRLTAPSNKGSGETHLGQLRIGLKNLSWAKFKELGPSKVDQIMDSSYSMGNFSNLSPTLNESAMTLTKKVKQKLNPREIEIESTITNSILHSVTLASFLSITPPPSLFHLKLIPDLKSTTATSVASQSNSTVLTFASPRTIAPFFLPVLSRKVPASLNSVCPSKPEEGLKLDESKGKKQTHLILKEKFKDICRASKELLGNKVKREVINDRAVNFFCSLVTGEFGWNANMETVMTAQKQRNSSIADYMSGMKTLEIHHEDTPPTDDWEYKSSLAAIIFNDMQSGNDEAIGLMQGWLGVCDLYQRLPEIQIIQLVVPIGNGKKYGDLESVAVAGTVDADISGETKPLMVDYKPKELPDQRLWDMAGELENALELLTTTKGYEDHGGSNDQKSREKKLVSNTKEGLKFEVLNVNNRNRSL